MRSGQVPVWATGCCVASEDPLGKSFPRRMDFCVYMKDAWGQMVRMESLGVTLPYPVELSWFSQ